MTIPHSKRRSCANGVGKTLGRNIAHHALVYGHIVLFTSAGRLLGDRTRQRFHAAPALRHYAHPDLLAIDEVGSTLIASNRPFVEWHEVIPNVSVVPWSTASPTTESWPSRATPIASRKRRSDPSATPRSVVGASHDKTTTS